MKQRADEILAELTAAVDGLLYPSESDEPFQPFAWPASAGRTAREAVEHHTNGKQPVVSQTVKALFGDLADADDAMRFAALRRLLEDRLSKSNVYRVGETQVVVYILANTPAAGPAYAPARSRRNCRGWHRRCSSTH